MSKMHFPTAVKYNGVNYEAHQSFTVKDKDIPELKEAGGIVDYLTPETPKRTAKTSKPKEQ